MKNATTLNLKTSRGGPPYPPRTRHTCSSSRRKATGILYRDGRPAPPIERTRDPFDFAQGKPYDRGSNTGAGRAPARGVVAADSRLGAGGDSTGHRAAVSKETSWSSAHWEAGCSCGNPLPATTGGRGSDPVATLIARANAKRFGLDNVEVRCMDYLSGSLQLDEGTTAFIGNPPYVRHHRLPSHVKAWGAGVAKRLNLPFSKLAGLHVYFFLATALRAKPGDLGCFITSAEWLDVGYGRALRKLLRDRLGLVSISLLHESSDVFDDAMTTAAVTCFRVGSNDLHVLLSRVSEFTAADGADKARAVPRSRLGGRWGHLLRNGQRPEDATRQGWVRLGDVASVHRGVATGANDFFVMDAARAERLGLAACTKPVVTSAKQILSAGGCLDGSACRVLLTLPRDLSLLPDPAREAALRYLAEGEERGIHERYLCRHRRPWWWLGEATPPPIIASYMARCAPAFACNPDGVRILNIAHGVYPSKRMSAAEVRALARALNKAAHTFVGNGRLYQGGLEKFEPREMEDLLIPPPADWNI